MPELPEVETVKKALKRSLEGSVISGVRVSPPPLRRLPSPSQLDEFCRNNRVVEVRRRGKYLIVELAELKAVLIHLGMTGNIRIEDREYGTLDNLSPHDHVFWQLADARTMIFRDSRRFGMVILQWLTSHGAEPECLHGMGPEPFSPGFSGSYLYRKTRHSRRTVKDTLMDQGVVAGIGNIYASEILFSSGVAPFRKSGNVARKVYQKVVDAARDILRRAIDSEGTTISDYATVSGEEGGFALSLQVYGKTGETCPRCGNGAAVEYRKISGRATYYCPHCQC